MYKTIKASKEEAEANAAAAAAAAAETAAASGETVANLEADLARQREELEGLRAEAAGVQSKHGEGEERLAEAQAKVCAIVYLGGAWFHLFLPQSSRFGAHTLWDQPELHGKVLCKQTFRCAIYMPLSVSVLGSARAWWVLTALPTIHGASFIALPPDPP